MQNINLFKGYEGVFEAEDTEEVSDKKEKTERTFAYSPFALQDAIGERSVKKIWIEYQKLRLSGIEAEELIHKIISKVRDMAAIAMGASKDDLGIKNDYPYNKSKRDSQKWKEKDLKKFYSKLVEIHHLSRMESNNNLDVSIEKMILNI